MKRVQSNGVSVLWPVTRLAPARSPPGYELLVESDRDVATLEKLAERLDAELCVSPSYKYARDLGQLAPVRVQPVTRGWLTYSERLIAAGQRAGDIKPAHLDLRPGWAEAFRAKPEPVGARAMRLPVPR